MLSNSWWHPTRIFGAPGKAAKRPLLYTGHIIVSLTHGPAILAARMEMEMYRLRFIKYLIFKDPTVY